MLSLRRVALGINFNTLSSGTLASPTLSSLNNSGLRRSIALQGSKVLISILMLWEFSVAS